MALDFPASPTDGQIYDNYYWDNTNSVWRLLGDSLEVAADFSNTATGTYTDGFDYKYVSFTASGSLTVTRGGYADVLLVGGGGSGGAGGGGAGGMLYVENAYLSAGALTVTVGAGGVCDSVAGNWHATPNNGMASILGSYVSPGGGAGGYLDGYDPSNAYIGGPGLNGGSGGGVSVGNYDTKTVTAGAGITGLGNSGGLTNGGLLASGGGGGAGAVGSDGTLSPRNGGDGGAGSANSITGSSVVYAGGGGGGGYDAGGAGGTGGGGAGSGSGYAGNGGAGTDGLGGGGGGCTRDGVGGDGGSGIVIVRVRTN